MNAGDTVRWRLAYAALGWQTVPLNWPAGPASTDGCSCQRGAGCASPGKHPWVRWAGHGGTTDPALILGQHRRRPNSGVAILTGRERSGLFVVDVDPDHGGEDTIRALGADHGRLPDTLTAVTGSGGRHLLFRSPDGKARQTAGAIGPGVDTRSDGGLIVAAPSLHRSGNRYRWANWGTPPAVLPGWVLDRLKPETPNRPARLPPRNTARGTRYAEAALDRAVADLRHLAGANGVRNTSLNATAYSLGRLVGAGLITADRVGHALYAAALAIGLGPIEAADTITSGLRSGALRPKDIPA